LFTKAITNKEYLILECGCGLWGIKLDEYGCAKYSVRSRVSRFQNGSIVIILQTSTLKHLTYFRLFVPNLVLLLSLVQIFCNCFSHVFHCVTFAAVANDRTYMLKDSVVLTICF